MMRIILATTALSGLLLFASCGKERTPSRDHYPVLKDNVFYLQQAVAAKDRATLDSLMRADKLDRSLSVDSLLSFVFGPRGDYPFEVFGDCEIIYTDQKARIDCWIMDSTRTQNRPITFTYVNADDTLWWVKRFEVTPPVRPSGADTAIADSSR